MTSTSGKRQRLGSVSTSNDPRDQTSIISLNASLLGSEAPAGGRTTRRSASAAALGAPRRRLKTDEPEAEPANGTHSASNGPRADDSPVGQRHRPQVQPRRATQVAGKSCARPALGAEAGEAGEEEEEEEEDDDDDDDDDTESQSQSQSNSENDTETETSPRSRSYAKYKPTSLQEQLAASGPAGVAAAAAIATARKRKRPHCFETNPSVRKRQQTRLIRKLRACIDEYTARVGQQAIVLITMPGKQAHNFKVFGAQPLESVIRSCKEEIMAELEQAVLEQTPARYAGAAGSLGAAGYRPNGGGQGSQPLGADPEALGEANRHELPALVIEGIPTPVEKMTQAQLRAFIPLMLKYSTGRGKPGWGKESTRPAWWPSSLPWANVRSDARDEEEKQRVSWTTTLREIVTNCYKFHGREDLLPSFDEDQEAEQAENGPERPERPGRHSATGRDLGDRLASLGAGRRVAGAPRPLGSRSSRCDQLQMQQQQQQQHQQQQLGLYGQTSASNGGYVAAAALGGQANGSFMHTIANSDGSVSLVQLDPANAQILTLPDGTQVRAVRLQALASSDGQTFELAPTESSASQSQSGALADDQHHQLEGQQMQGTADTLAEGQIILTNEDGSQNCYPVSQLVSIPASMYQQFAAAGQPLQIVTTTDASQLSLHSLQEAQELSAQELGAEELNAQELAQHQQQVAAGGQLSEQPPMGPTHSQSLAADDSGAQLELQDSDASAQVKSEHQLQANPDQQQRDDINQNTDDNQRAHEDDHHQQHQQQHHHHHHHHHQHHHQHQHQSAANGHH